MLSRLVQLWVLNHMQDVLLTKFFDCFLKQYAGTRKSFSTEINRFFKLHLFFENEDKLLGN